MIILLPKVKESTVKVRQVLSRLKRGRLASYSGQRGQKHKVFERSFDARDFPTEDIFLQKLEYIHYNPVKGKWNLADNYINYEHSSALFYDSGLVKQFRPKHFKEL